MYTCYTELTIADNTTTANCGVVGYSIRRVFHVATR